LSTLITQMKIQAASVFFSCSVMLCLSISASCVAWAEQELKKVQKNTEKMNVLQAAFSY
jgi:hypothetical protein